MPWIWRRFGQPSLGAGLELAAQFVDVDGEVADAFDEVGGDPAITLSSPASRSAAMSRCLNVVKARGPDPRSGRSRGGANGAG